MINKKQRIANKAQRIYIQKYKMSVWVINEKEIFVFKTSNIDLNITNEGHFTVKTANFSLEIQFHRSRRPNSMESGGCS